MTDFCLNYLRFKNPRYDLINVGSGTEITIKELAKKISKIIDYNGNLEFDKKIPDGHLRKFLNISKSKSLGFKKKIDLNLGLKKTYNYYLKNIVNN